MATSPGILVLDRTGRIGFATDSALAMLRPGDGLTVRGGRLAAPRAALGLDDAVEATLRDPLARGAAPVRSLALCRRDRLPLVATLTPLAAPATGPLGALVLLHDPEAVLRPAAALLRQAFGLTPAEAAVAQALLQGAALREIAAQRGVGLATVRTLLARAMDKTGTHRQAELVRLLLPLATAEAVRAGFEAGLRLGAGGGLPASWPVRPRELLRADLAAAGRQEARVTVHEFAAGTGNPTHRHQDAHEIVYVLAGSIRGEWGHGESRVTGAGELLHYGPDLPHCGCNPGAAPNRLLVTRILRLGPRA